MSTNQNNPEEEVDLGSLFVIIGKGFSNFFNFIGSIFRGIFHGMISVLIFFRKNAIKIGIPIIIGGLVGVFLESKKEDVYGSDLLVQPNFNSTRLLYNNINYYNDLVSQKKTEEIKRTFNIDEEKAKSFKSFTIEPVFNENNIIDTYNSFVLSIDTTAIKSYSFQEFKRSFTDFDYKTHNINVVSDRNDVFNDLDEVIISSIVKNKYFNKKKTLTNENLNRTDSLLRQNLGQVDSLRKVYMQVMLAEAKKKSNGTSIDLGGEKRTTKELELFATNRTLNADLGSVIDQKAENYEIVNIISNFQPIGYKIEGITKNATFQFAILGGLLMVLFLLLRQLNTYLKNYNK